MKSCFLLNFLHTTSTVLWLICIASGMLTPKPHGATSSQHHGQCTNALPTADGMDNDNNKETTNDDDNGGYSNNDDKDGDEGKNNV